MKLHTSTLLRTIDAKLNKVTTGPCRVQVASKYGTMSLEASDDEAFEIIRGWLTPELAKRLNDALTPPSQS